MATVPVYKRVEWRCASCGVLGLTLRHRDDSNARFQWRLEQSHQSRSRRCPTMELTILTARERRPPAAVTW